MDKIKFKIFTSTVCKHSFKLDLHNCLIFSKIFVYMCTIFLLINKYIYISYIIVCYINFIKIYF